MARTSYPPSTTPPAAPAACCPWPRNTCSTAPRHPHSEASVEKFVTVHGQELSPTNYAICQADLLIKNDPQAKVYLGNSLIPHEAHSKEPGD